MAASAYPKIGAKAWATLRDKAVDAPTTKFTPDLVASLMGMASPDSALGNTVRPMRRLGLIDEDGALTDRGKKWRVDESFGDACQEILDEIYPDVLGALTADDGSPDSAKIKTWFAHQGFGQVNARQMAATYVMVAGKRLPETVGADSGNAKPTASPSRKAPRTPSKQKVAEKPQDPETHEPPSPPAKSDSGPTVHLDIQIHIPADATPAQIDQIFSSMAKHLYAK